MRGYVKNKHSRKPLAEHVVDHKARGCLVPIAAARPTGILGALSSEDISWPGAYVRKLSGQIEVRRERLPRCSPLIRSAQPA
jgi:hypothetical protein